MGRVGRVLHGMIILLLLCSSSRGAGPDSVVTALERQDAWLAPSPQAEGWNRYLLSDVLRAELSKEPGEVDRRAIARVLGRYDSGVPSLQHRNFNATRRALASWANVVKVPMAVRWSEQLRSSAPHTAPISEAALRKARYQLRDAANALEQMLAGASPATRDGWKAFLKWSDLQTQLNMGTPNWKTLEGVAVQFYNGHPGLEFPQFVRVREALFKYLYLGTLGANGTGQRSIQSYTNALADALDEYNSKPTTKNAARAAELLDWLNQLDRVPKLAPAIRGAHLMPNVKIRVSEALLSRRFAQSVNEPAPVNENILGTHVRGTSITTGNISTDVVPNRNVARVDIVFRGQTHTKSIGRQKPVTVRSTSVTALEARKPLYLYPTRVTSDPAAARGRTRTTIHSITSDRQVGRKLVERIAWQRANSQKAQAESIASARTARRFERQMDNKSQELLTRAQQTLREQLRGPINRRGLIPEKIRTLSHDDSAIVLATQADRSQFAATSTPPMFCPHDDVVAQVHESAINNTAEKAIAGLTLTDERIAELMQELTGSVPEELQIREEDQPWSIQFDYQQPVTVEFDNQQMTIAVRGRRFTSGERVLDNKVMEMSATYSMKTSPSGVTMVRQGEIDVTFPNNTQSGLRATDRIFKTLMQNKFSELFKEEIQGEGFSLPGRFEELGTIRLNDLSAENGWLSLGWK